MVVKETVFVSAFRHKQKIEDLGLGEPFYNLIIQLVRKGVHTATQGLSRSGSLGVGSSPAIPTKRRVGMEENEALDASRIKDLPSWMSCPYHMSFKPLDWLYPSCNTLNRLTLDSGVSIQNPTSRIRVFLISKCVREPALVRVLRKEWGTCAPEETFHIANYEPSEGSPNVPVKPLPTGHYRLGHIIESLVSSAQSLWWKSMALVRPLHDWVMEILRCLPISIDGTFNQPVRSGIGQELDAHHVWSRFSVPRSDEKRDARLRVSLDKGQLSVTTLYGLLSYHMVVWLAVEC
ncbi:hypothetical protein WN943_019149 [Citrus x changshan-huyou]